MLTAGRCGRRPPMLRSLILSFVSLLGICAAFGQAVPPVTTPPPPIAFQPWREVDHSDDAIEYDVSFPSAIVTRYPENNVVPLRVFVPTGAKGPAPVVLILHYWGATDLRAEVSLAQELASRNVGSAIMTLPYHLARTPAGRRSGDLAIEPDPQRLVETMTQSVYDARRSLDFLATRPEFRTDEVGIAGTSLGAIVAALAYSVEPRFKAASFLLGGADLAHVLWSSSRVVRQRDVLRRRGYTEARLRKELEPIEPLHYLPRADPGATFLVEARYDTVVPRESAEALIEHLPGVRTLVLDTGHYGGIFVERRLLREVATFFADEFGNKNFVPPSQIYAPTIRLGFKLDTADGLDVGAGLDLFKFNARGDTFTTLFITPRGPQLLLEHRLFDGLSFGLTGTTRQIGIGLFWSAVL